MLIQKQNYYKGKQTELKETAEVQKEATHLDKVVRDKELQEVQTQREELT